MHVSNTPARGVFMLLLRRALAPHRSRMAPILVNLAKEERELRRKLVTWGVVLVFLAALLSGCSSGTKQQSSTSSASEKKVRIGIVQIVEHPALDAARKGFLDTLKAKGYEEGKNLEVDYENAQGDQTMLQTIAKKLVSNKPDLILAIATPSAQAVAAETTTIPILITAVTDPVAAKLVKSNEKPRTNVTGTTDMNPVKEQIELVKKFVPKATKIGVIYNAGEVNSQVQVDKVKEVAGKNGLTVVEATVSSSSEVMQAAQSLVGRVQAIYLPTDNVVASSVQSVVKVAEKNALPVIAGEKGMVDNGALATIGIDYYKLGQQTAEMAIRVLNGEKPENMPIESQKEYKLFINKDAAARMKVAIPEDLLKQAGK